ITRLNKDRAPLFIEDTSQPKVLAEAFASRGITTTLLIPLVVGNTLTGIVSVDAEDPRTFDADQRDLAQTVLNQVAVSVQNAQLFQETVARQRELGLLFEAGRIASASLNLENVVQNAAGYFIRALNADSSAIYLWDRERDRLDPLIDIDNTEGQRPEATAIGLSRYPAIRSVVHERGALTLSRSSEAISDVEAAYLMGSGAESALMLPLIARDDVIGMAELRTRNPERRFSQSEIRLVRALAASIATAMENARLHDETQRRLGELATINTISRSLSQTISSEDLYDILRTQLENVLDVHSMTVVRYDPQTNMLSFPLVMRSGELTERPPEPVGSSLYSYIIRTGEPLLLSGDIDSFRAEQDIAQTYSGIRSLIAVPLQTGESTFGVLAVEDYVNDSAFSESDLRVLGPIAAQVAVSLENTRLYGELQQRLSETTTLQEVSRVVNSALDLQEIFDKVVSELARAFGYPLIGLFTLEGRELILQANHGYENDPNLDRLRIVSVEEGIIGRAVMNGEAELVRDVTQDPDYIPVKEWVTSLIAVPIVSDEFLLGVLAVQSDENRPLAENDLELLKTFAGQVATAMVNASLYTQMVELSEELERRVDERTRELSEERDRINTLFSITVELTASLDLDRVLNRALQLVGEAIGAEYGALFLIDPQSDQLIHRAAMSNSEIIPPGGRQVRLRRQEGMAGWVMENRESIIVGNVQEDPRWSNVAGTEERRSLLGAPLIANEEVLGCLFFSSDNVDVFNAGHLQLVEAAANQVATSINNAELYRLIRDQAERLGTMLRSQQTEAAKSQAILESTADGVMVSDATGEIILFNAAAERVLGLRRDEVLGRPSSDLTRLYGAGAQPWEDMLDTLGANPEAYETGEFQSIQLEIGKRFVSVNVAPVMHSEEYLGLVSVFRDITREVAADRAKSEFVANVSHELRTPMTSIKGYADLLLLQAAGEINDEQRRFLEVIKSNADRLTALVNDLLTISSIEQQDIDLDLRDVHVGEVISDVLDTYAFRMSNDLKKTLTLAMDVPDDLPTVQGDYDRITQIVQNLVGNAYNYTEDGGTITVSAEVEGAGVVIHVADTGIGIAYEQQERVFERFFRGVEHPMVMATAGTGLGLAIVRELVNMHDGAITFESEPGVGSTFSVWLPFELDLLDS
ncbi:MAG: GAF domain-containing protein, partial [Chloroflexi bacterium]|nr:GAF domain-containing protein [Chloroflexota bacterium]